MTDERIAEALRNVSESELVIIFNEFCSENSYCDDYIYPMEEFDDIMNSSTESEGPLWLAQRIFFGDFNPNHDWFRFNGYGNLCSTDYLSDWEESGVIDIEAISAWLNDTQTWADYLGIEEEENEEEETEE